MKRGRLFILFLAAALLLGGCTPQTQAPSSAPALPTSEPSAPADPQASARTAALTELFSDPSKLPRIDGSTACIPLMLQCVEDLCGMDPEQAQHYISATGTGSCWWNLLEGYSDLLLAYEIPEDVNDYRDENDAAVELEYSPIGRDALVFLVNETNPIQSLTQQQLIDIYTGSITNWSSLGGEALEIAPFQRDASSGSQTLFRKLLMKDIEPMKATDSYTATDMGSLIEVVSDYNNAGNAIGYSVYYYVTQMKNEPGVRLLPVDGIAPDNSTIADCTYPLTNEFYVAIRADEPNDSPTRLLYDWLCGAEGRQCLLDAGYVPA